MYIREYPNLCGKKTSECKRVEGFRRKERKNLRIVRFTCRKGVRVVPGDVIWGASGV